jgi:hypothetical protein
MKNAKKTVVLVVILALGAYTWFTNNGLLGPKPGGPVVPPPTHALTDAYNSRLSDVQVEGQGVVSRILPDDREGSRHQRFVLRLPNGRTLLVTHNIDLAPRINALREGDTVSFYGEYEWNEKGGLIHWTHHDPDGRHVDGWLRHEGRVYQ